MAQQNPSLYPTPAAHHDVPPPPPPSAELGGKPSTSGAIYGTQETLPPDYEVVLEMQARLTQQPTIVGSTKLSKPVEGTLRIIQGPLPPATPDQSLQEPSFHAFLSIGDVNLPLLPKCVASRVPNRPSFKIILPAGEFIVEPNPKTEEEIIDGFERICRWFCCWEVDQTGATASSSYTAAINEPTGASPYPPPPPGVIEPEMGGTVAVESPRPMTSADRIARAGDKGVLIVEKFGDALHRKITSTLEKRRDGIPEENRKNVKMGGRVTASVLTTTRKVVGTGAHVASMITDKVASSLGSAVSNNKVSRSMASAPEGSAKRTMYDNLMAGMMVIGKVYVAADQKGKIIINDVTELSSDIAKKRYGEEAAHAARSLGGIALDGYRISRFPQKLGARSLISSAAKASAKRSHGGKTSPPPAIGHANDRSASSRQSR